MPNISIQLSESEYDRFSKIAKKRNLSVTQAFGEALGLYDHAVYYADNPEEGVYFVEKDDHGNVITTTPIFDKKAQPKPDIL